MRQILVLVCLFAATWSGCSEKPGTGYSQIVDKPPLADTLVAIFHELRAAALSDRANDLVTLLDSAEARRLRRVCGHYNLPGLRQYLESRFAGWPEPDTLTLEDLIFQPPYARIAFAGAGSQMGRQEERVRFTFLLFRRVAQDWRLTAISTLDKDRYDRYGTPISFLETELPSSLRFPRLF
ncbi:MAG: hypothetical protein NTW07_12255 [candidate division Zixibacteria bacterium]|nr:hypothetical protein [candidate division Zixibacteria bacterium]